MDVFDINSNSGIIIENNTNVSPVFTELSLIYSSQAGHSQIYKGKRFGKWHALKTLKKEYANLSQYQNLFTKEFEISYLLTHPDIVQVIGLEEVELSEHDRRWCMIMEYIDGITLQDFLENNTVTAEEILPLIEEICNAVNYIHKKGIIHRDIKTTNILVTHNGNHAKLIDLGLGDTNDYAILKEPAGSFPYASPEQKEQIITIDNRADIYALGIVLQYISSKTETRLPHINEIIKKCTAENRDKRFSSAKEIYLKLSNTKDYRTLAIIASIFITAVLSSFLAYNTGRHIQPRGAKNHTEAEIRSIDQQSMELSSPIIIYDSISNLVIEHATQKCRCMISSIDTVKIEKRKIGRFYDAYKDILRNKEKYPVTIMDKCLPKNCPEYNLYKTSLIKLAEDIYNNFYTKKADSLRLITKNKYGKK